MEYFSKFLGAGSPQQSKPVYDHVNQFHQSWLYIKATLEFPDERQLTKGIAATDVSAHLKLMVDALVWESTRAEEGTTGQCLEYLLKNDVLGYLVRLSEAGRPFGIQAEVLRAVSNMVVLLDEQFLVHSVVHRAVLRLLRTCIGDQIEEQFDGGAKVMGAASNASRSTPSEYEEDLVDLLCILCSRIRTFRELLMIFFHDKHWYQSHLQTVHETNEEDGSDDTGENDGEASLDPHMPSPTSSQTTITSGQASAAQKKTEYEFLLFNYLLRFVHREGRIGDFARAGLLFLMDVAISAAEPTASLLNETSDTKLDIVNLNDSVADAALALAEYILDGDFSDVLGAGLGAVYSLLPSKLDTRRELSISLQQVKDGVALGVGFYIESAEQWQLMDSERAHNRSHGLESTSSPEFRARLDHFLKLLEFIEDVLRRNNSPAVHSSLAPSTLVGSAIVQSILDSIRSVFLENILYTSILECSDSDGSAVAVMLYIDIMIRTLGNSQLGELLVNFLMSEDEHHVRHPHPRILALDRNRRENERAKRVRRRKSSAMVLLEMEAPDSRRQSEYYTSLGRFTLKDLIFSNIRSSHQATSTVAFQLLQTLLIHHPIVCTEKLLIAHRDPTATSFPYSARHVTDYDSTLSEISMDDDVFVYPGNDVSISQFSPLYKEPSVSYLMHELEMGMYFGLISRIRSPQNYSPRSTGYENYLNDAIVLIRSHTLFRQDAFLDLLSSQSTLHHRLDANDPLLRLLLDALRDFFSHSPAYNMALTGLFASLCLDPYRSLSGWLTFDTSSDTSPAIRPLYRDNMQDLSTDGDDRSFDFHPHDGYVTSVNPDLVTLPLNEALRPIIYSLCLGLVDQLDKYRASIKDFDKHLLERRQGLFFSENLNDALNLNMQEKEMVRLHEELPIMPHVTSTPIRKTKPKGSSFASFLSPKKRSSSTGTTTPESRTHSQKTVITASPFVQHYRQTRLIGIQSSSIPLPSTGPWSRSKQLPWSLPIPEDVFNENVQWGETQPSGYDIHREDGSHPAVTEIPLSCLLDNVAILEESIKELTAIIQVRRSLGIDSVRYM